MIRPAMPADVLAVQDIWNAVIRDSTITFTAIPKTEPEIAALIARDCLVWENGGRVHGFARFGPFRGGDGYRFTAEHTIHLHPDARGQGGGSALLTALCNAAKTAGIHSLFAGCSAENPAAVRFHAAHGFTEVATLPQVGFKFGRWIGLVLMQKML